MSYNRGMEGWKGGSGSGSGSGSGIGLPNFGVGVGAVSVNQCPSSDDSWFCQFSRGFQVFMSIVTILIFVYFAFTIMSELGWFRKSKKSWW